MAHDAVAAGQARKAHYLFVDTAGRYAHQAQPDAGIAKTASRDGQATAGGAARGIAGARRDDWHECAEPSAGIQQGGAAVGLDLHYEAGRHQQRGDGSGDSKGTGAADQVHRLGGAHGRSATVRREAVRRSAVRRVSLEDHYMRLALRLARRGYGMTSPNPMVGAVLVKRGRIIGRGWHRRAGEPHAEIEALHDCQLDPDRAADDCDLGHCSAHALPF